MASAQQTDTESQDRLRDLQAVIREVFLPTLESKSEIKHNILKFTNQINNALTQAYGNVTIYVPPQTADDEFSVNPTVLKQYQNAVEDWTKKITETIEKEEKKATERAYLTAQGEYEFWSNRSATFNTLGQQLALPAVKKITNLLGNNKDSAYQYVLEQYSSEQKRFMKAQLQAKDFVKYLATLERQFKVISKGDLKAITETMKSLLDGLKLIWTISKHISHNIELFEHILEAISNEICQKVREKINIKTIFTKKKPEHAIADIEAGIQVLEKWDYEFGRTRQEIEN